MVKNARYIRLDNTAKQNVTKDVKYILGVATKMQTAIKRMESQRNKKTTHVLQKDMENMEKSTGVYFVTQ